MDDLQKIKNLSATNQISAPPEPFSSPQIAAQLAQEASKTAHCPACGASVGLNDKFCGACGNKLQTI